MLGEYSSVWLERWFVVPEVVGSSPIIRPRNIAPLWWGIIFGKNKESWTSVSVTGTDYSCV